MGEKDDENNGHYCHCQLTAAPPLVLIGTSVRRSSRSAFGRPTGNDVSGQSAILGPPSGHFGFFVNY